MQFVSRSPIKAESALLWAAARGQEHDQIIIFLIFTATQEAFSFFNTSLAEVEAMQA